MCETDGETGIDELGYLCVRVRQVIICCIRISVCEGETGYLLY